VKNEDIKKAKEIKEFLSTYFPKEVLEKVAIKILTNKRDKTLKNLKKDTVKKDALYYIQKFIDQQSNDEGLWFVAQTASEAYLQQELRKLHQVIEEYSLESI
jgi:phage-related protein